MELKNLKKKFNLLHKYSFDGVEKTIQHVASQAVSRMRKAAPFDTGRLRREIDYTTAHQNLVIHSEAFDPETGEDYAPLQEFGSRRRGIRAQPFFYRNIRWMFDALYKDINRKIKNILNKTR